MWFLALLCLLQTEPPPKTSVLHSASGEWTVVLTRKTYRNWNGPAELEVLRGGFSVWTARHDFGIRMLRVNDSGHVAGFGYSGEHPGEAGEEILRVFAFAPDGKLVIDESHPRRSSNYPDGSPNPQAISCFIQSEPARFVVRVRDEDLNRYAERWWGYDLDDGMMLFTVQPSLDHGLAPA